MSIKTMAPLRGVIVKAIGQIHTIRLENRALLKVPRRKDMWLGDTVYVLYDYTRLRVKSVWSEEEMLTCDDKGNSETITKHGTQEPINPYDEM